MNAITEKTVQLNGCDLHFIPTKKFKTITISAKFRAPLERKTITKRALLPYILRQATKNYPSRKELQVKLDELYGAVFSAGASKKGEEHVLGFRMEIANARYLPAGKDFTEEAIRTFHELIYEPYLPDGKFSESIFKREKETLKQRIQSVRDDKIRYANMRLIDEMCEGEAYSLHLNGYEDDLEALTNEALYEYYEKMKTADILDVYVVGDFDPESMEELFSANFLHSKEDNKASQQRAVKKKVTDRREVIEKEPIQQAKLHIGYRTNTVYADADYAALQVFNGIFGGFPSSKLFINVREKHSLAYYASSALESHKGLLFVYCGIAPEDYEKARDIIREQMEEMKAGKFTDDDIEEAKEMVIHFMREAMDSSNGLVELFYQQQVAGLKLSLQELFKRIESVTNDDVIKMADKLEEDTLYLLTSEGGN